jgi:glycosyltransferase involved in cell wall biosynthesis
MGAIHAIEKIAPEIGTFKFVIVGDGPELSRLEAEVERVGLQDRIVFTGQLPHEITLRYLNAADILILNTSYEGFSHLLLESLALGTSVVTTPVGGNPEIIEHARNGLLVPYNNISALAEAVKSLAHDDRLRQTFAQAGRRTAERFTRDKTVSGLLKALS